MPDINSYLDNITSSIKQLRQDLNDLQLEERPSIRSGLWASRPPNASLRTGDRYYATDSTRNIEYVWDGTRWLTTQNYPVALSAKLGVSATFTLSASTSAVNQGPHPDGSSDVYITNIVCNLFPNGTNNGSNFWIAQFRTRTSAAANSNTYTGNTSTGTTGTIIPIVINVNAVVTRANFFDIVQDVNTSGTPGTVNFFPAVLNCRLVGA